MAWSGTGASRWSALAIAFLFVVGECQGADGWVDLLDPAGFEKWRAPTGSWMVAGDARPDSTVPNLIVAEPGTGVIVNGKTGKTANLLSKEEFGDVEAQFEFLIPKGSNSGVKFEGLYEIQIIDSFGKTKLSGSDCGGIYPKAEMLPKYHHTDEGIAPSSNASKRFGEWQTLEVVFRAPRFDSGGQKVKSAVFEKVVLNGQLIHSQVEQKTPTGHYWRMKEVAKGPLMIQADHGPVAFRKIRVKALD
jgi:hypothetical protein